MRALSCLLLFFATGCVFASHVAEIDQTRPRVVYYESTDPSTVREESVYEGFDGAELGFVRHLGGGDTALVYLHGIQSHAGWFDGPADMLCAAGYDVYCLDRRGSGINRENRGFASGDVDRYETYLKDIKAFVAPLRRRYESVFLIGLSWGGKLALAYGLAHPEDCRGLVLITPGLRSKVDLSLGDKLEVGMGSAFAPKRAIPIPIEPAMFTKTPSFLEKITSDPLNLREATARFFLQSVNLERFVDREMPNNELPLLVLLAAGDQIVDNAGVRDVLLRGQQETDLHTYENQIHSLQFDAPEQMVADIKRWLADRR